MPVPYTNAWNEANPLGSVLANQIDEYIRAASTNVRERLVDILGITFPADTVTEVTASKLVLKGAASPKIIPGATSIVFRNNADTQDNLVITNAGAVSIPSGDFSVSNTAGGRNINIDGTVGNTRTIRFRTGSSARWTIQAGTGAEAGANAGSDFSLGRYDDAGAFIGNPITIVRSTGIVTLTNGLVVSSGGITITAGGLTVSANGITITGTSTFSGDITITTVVGGRNLSISGQAGNSKNIKFQTGGVDRWLVTSNTTAEGGANAGSNFNISRMDDAGVFIETAFSIIRSTGNISIPQSVTIGNGLTISAGNVTLSGGNVSITGFVTASATSTFSANIQVGSNGASDRFITLTGSAGQQRGITFASSNSNRWILMVTNTAESGGNAGSDFLLQRYDDAGVFLGSVIQITRSTGLVTVNQGVTVSGTNDLIRANTAGDSTFIIQSNVGFTRSIYFRTGSSSRWRLGTNSIAESGANAGSDFFIQNFDDAGSLLGTVLSIARSSGTVTLSGAINIGSSVSATSYIDTSVGFRIGGAATNANFLRGNGTNFVSSAIQTTDIPAVEACKALRTTDFNLAAVGVDEVLSWDSEEFDTSSMHNTAVNNSRITAPVTGKYLVIAQITWLCFGASAHYVQTSLKKNGVATALVTSSLDVPATGNLATAFLNTIVQLNAGDYLEIYVKSSDITINPDISGTNALTFFTVARIY